MSRVAGKDSFAQIKHAGERIAHFTSSNQLIAHCLPHVGRIMLYGPLEQYIPGVGSSDSALAAVSLGSIITVSHPRTRSR